MIDSYFIPFNLRYKIPRLYSYINIDIFDMKTGIFGLEPETGVKIVLYFL